MTKITCTFVDACELNYECTNVNAATKNLVFSEYVKFYVKM